MGDKILIADVSLVCVGLQYGLAAIPGSWKEQVDDYKALEKLVDKVIGSRST